MGHLAVLKSNVLDAARADTGAASGFAGVGSSATVGWNGVQLSSPGTFGGGLDAGIASGGGGEWSRPWSG